jgi:hypothetical protein
MYGQVLAFQEIKQAYQTGALGQVLAAFTLLAYPAHGDLATGLHCRAWLAGLLP